MKIIQISAVFALLAVPSGLAAQTAGQASAEAAVQAAASAGLPQAPVRRTIEEGRARGASEAQIGNAALAVHARLSAARDALRREGKPEPTDAEITAGADAMVSGASRSDLRLVRDAAPADRSVATSLSVLAELSARGAHSEKTAMAIASRLRAGQDDRAVAAMATGGNVGAAAAGGTAGTGIDAHGGIAVGADLLGSTSALTGSLDVGVAGL